MALADTITSHNYLDEIAIPYCSTMVPEFGPQVKVANGNIIILVAQTEMHISKELSKQAQHAYIFDDLATGLLISTGQVFDDDCLVLFSKYSLKYSRTTKSSLQET